MFGSLVYFSVNNVDVLHFQVFLSAPECFSILSIKENDADEIFFKLPKLLLFVKSLRFPTPLIFDYVFWLWLIIHCIIVNIAKELKVN